ncbi:MAG: methionyl-tRNA formyltransferase [Acidobacteria bacterium]|nr:methionyl-tRNA formyltransferase [Acidobacteriota bacterium]
MRVVFFGTPEFAVPSLDALLRSRHTVAAVVTQPDRPRGRGHQISASPVKVRALASSIPVLQPARLRDEVFLAALRALGADLGVVAAYGRILTEDVLRTPRLGMVNVHASLLPRHRGAAPVHRAIIAGDRETGVTIMRVVLALDAGPMLAAVRRPIGPEETSSEVERDLALLGAPLLAGAVDALAAGTAVETLQDEARATYAARLSKEDGDIDWSQPAPRIHDLVRGLHPWPHAQTRVHGARLIVLRSSPAPDSAMPPASAPPGTVVSAAPDDLRVAAGQGVLRLLEIQREGRRPMNAREFLAGHRLVPGDRLGP